MKLQNIEKREKARKTKLLGQGKIFGWVYGWMISIRVAPNFTNP